MSGRAVDASTNADASPDAAPEAGLAGLPPRIHCVGVGGGGLSALALLLAERGHEVSGSDGGAGFDPVPLASRGLAVARGHDAARLGAAQLVIRSAAVPDANPELAAARAAGLPVLKYSEALGRLMGGRLGVAVAGTHGKSTTTALVAHLLRAAGRDPAWVVGARPLSLPAPAGWGAGPAMVVEACEYDLSFLNLSYEVALVTGTAPDHLDCFGDAAGVEAAFRRFASRLPPGGTLVLGRDVPRALRFELAEGVRVRRVDEELELRDVVETVDGFAGRVVERGPVRGGPAGARGARVAGATNERSASASGTGAFRLPLLGRHNLDNLAAALLAAQAAGASLAELLPHAAAFRGVARRLEDLGEIALPGGGSARLVDDFAHHPDALRAAAAAVRSRWPGRRAVAVFQPHQVSRTEDFLDDFAGALGAFDAVGLCDIFVARDAHPERAEPLAEALCARAGGKARRLGPAAEAIPRVRALLRPGDVCVVMGAGDIDGLAGGLAGAAARDARR